MSASKRPSTSSLRRYLTSRPYIAVADIRRRFALDPEAMSVVSRNGTTAYVGLPEREATKLQDLWQRDEVGVELSVEVRAPVIVGIYPIRIARFVIDQATNGNGYHPQPVEPSPSLDAAAPVEPVHAEPLHRPPVYEDVPEA
ncbi:MAG TPA: hypothetical protein VF365_04450 [Candidatus Limnocylindria bacterium]